MKERLQRLKFRLDDIPSPEAELVVYSDNQTNFGVKIIEPDNREINVSLYEVEGYYVGEKNPNKILYTQPVAENKGINDVNRELAKYDVIIAVDTSYDFFSGVKMAFTSIMIFNKLSCANEVYDYQQISQVVEWDATSIEKPENFMYMQAIESIRAHNKKLKQNPKIAVVIDSDLENIASFNNRSKPIFDDYFLPEDFHLFYASTDSGNEYFQNKLLKMCDKEAKEALKEYKKENPPTSHNTAFT